MRLSARLVCCECTTLWLSTFCTKKAGAVRALQRRQSANQRVASWLQATRDCGTILAFAPADSDSESATAAMEGCTSSQSISRQCLSNQQPASGN